jgi:hypothetical protein
MVYGFAVVKQYIAAPDFFGGMVANSRRCFRLNTVLPVFYFLQRKPDFLLMPETLFWPGTTRVALP